MKKIALSVALVSLSVSPVLAAHNNPWAGADDTVLAKNHDGNQEKSIGTPGEDEMRGQMNQNVNSNAGGSSVGGTSSGGSSNQAGGGNGGMGHGHARDR